MNGTAELLARSVVIVITAGTVHAAVLMITVPSAIAVPSVRITMHVTVMMVMTPGTMDLAVLCNQGAFCADCRARDHDDVHAGGTHRRRCPAPGARLHPGARRGAAGVPLGQMLMRASKQDQQLLLIVLSSLTRQCSVGETLSLMVRHPTARNSPRMDYPVFRCFGVILQLC